jgi:hypothetical protein
MIGPVDHPRNIGKSGLGALKNLPLEPLKQTVYRRFTRLTNALSKKIENHIASISLGYFVYNFIKIHRTLRVTPAMAADVTDRLWELEDLKSSGLTETPGRFLYIEWRRP